MNHVTRLAADAPSLAGGMVEELMDQPRAVRALNLVGQNDMREEYFATTPR